MVAVYRGLIVTRGWWPTNNVKLRADVGKSELSSRVLLCMYVSMFIIQEYLVNIVFNGMKFK